MSCGAFTRYAPELAGRLDEIAQGLRVGPT
jgi:hypothetical protein